MKQTLISLLTFTFITIAVTNANGVMADTGQYGEYGGTTPSKSISLDKMVNVNGDYVDNLSSTDFRFKPDSTVTFKLTVKNTSEDQLNNVEIHDNLPDFVGSVDTKKIGDNVSYNENDREITIPVGTLDSNESKTYYVEVKTVSQDELPADKGIICVTNNADATANDTPSDSDSSQFCIEKQVMGVETVPSTGPEMGILLGLGQITALAAGIYLKKRS